MSITINDITLHHIVPNNYQGGAFGGVARFDYELRYALPISIISHPVEHTNKLPDFENLDPATNIFIAGNGDCLQVPSRFKCIVVHHGCAMSHQIREPSWPGKFYVDSQIQMAQRPNTTFVAPSTFTAEMFERYHGIKQEHKIIHSIPLMKNLSNKNSKVVIGDWRNFNKGKEAVKKLRDAKSPYVFQQIKPPLYDKSPAYMNAFVYLTLSLSEGCSYSQLDALSFGIPVLSTDVSLFPTDVSSSCGETIPWYLRDNVEVVLDKLSKMYTNYESYDPFQWLNSANNYGAWTKQWIKLIKSLL